MVDRIDVDKDIDVEHKSSQSLHIYLLSITTVLFKGLFSRRDGNRTITLRNDIGADLQELQFDQELNFSIS